MSGDGKIWVSEIQHWVTPEQFSAALEREDIEMPDSIITRWTMTRAEVAAIWPEAVLRPVEEPE